MLARLGELAALVLDFVEKPDVLDCDHRLVGERGYQLDLLVAKRAYLGPVQSNDADRHAFAHQGDAQHGALLPPSQELGSRAYVISISKNIGYVDRGTRLHNAA